MTHLLFSTAPQEDPNNGALASARRAYELNPNDTSALQILAFVEAVSGDAKSALEHLNQQIRISPRDPHRYGVYNQFAMTWFFAGRYAEGARYAALGIEEAPIHGTLHGWLAMNCVGLGDLPKARSAFAEAQRLAPRWVERALSGGMVFRDKEQLDRATSFLRIAAGLQS